MNRFHASVAKIAGGGASEEEEALQKIAGGIKDSLAILASCVLREAPSVIVYNDGVTFHRHRMRVRVSDITEPTTGRMGGPLLANIEYVTPVSHRDTLFADAWTKEAGMYVEGRENHDADWLLGSLFLSFSDPKDASHTTLLLGSPLTAERGIIAHVRGLANTEDIRVGRGELHYALTTTIHPGRAHWGTTWVRLARSSDKDRRTLLFWRGQSISEYRKMPGSFYGVPWVASLLETTAAACVTCVPEAQRRT